MSSSWVKFRSQTPDPRLRLFCFPYAGGTATAFRPWGRNLPAGVEICPVEYPGHGTRRSEPLIKRVEALVAAAEQGLQAEFDRPFVLYGHSLGAVVAFELARRLVQKGDSPLQELIISGRRAPQLEMPHTTIHTMSDEDFLQAVMDRYGGVPKEVLEEPELLALMLPMSRADIEMYETYQFSPGDQLNCPITCLAGTQDRYHPAAQMEPWQEQTSAECSVTIFSGTHFFINERRGEILETLAQRLRCHL